MLSRGDRVGDYEIIAPLRSGGMAMLYLARRRGVGGFSRAVALKLVHAHLTDDANINRLFLQEARIAASVAHPNVVQVDEVGSADGKYFMAMEYVHGVSLAGLLANLTKRKLRMSPKLSVWVAAQIAEALHAAHDAKAESGAALNIVHRDVSPQNVLVGHTGHIKLIDFGIAKSQSASQQASSGTSVLGKLGYMAPEQLRIRPVDRRTDVYALGVMLWEMLTSRSLLRRVRVDDERDWSTRETPPPPSRYATNSTQGLDQAVLKAIAYEADDRYESALEFRAALLRAEPVASQIDAPMFAALMQRLMGEELQRRRASWPNEVNAQLDSAAESERVLNIDELTVRLRSSELPGACDDEPEELPTQRESPVALRARFGDDADARAQRGTDQASAGSIQAQIVTVSTTPSTARPLGLVGRALQDRALRARAFGWVVLALSGLIGAYAGRPIPAVSQGSQDEAAVISFARDAAPAPVAPARAAGEPDDLRAPPPDSAPKRLELDETSIVSSAAAEFDAAPGTAPPGHGSSDGQGIGARGVAREQNLVDGASGKPAARRRAKKVRQRTAPGP